MISPTTRYHHHSIFGLLSLFILLTGLGLYIFETRSVLAQSLLGTDKATRWLSMEDMLQQMELAGVSEPEMDRLCFAAFSAQYQLEGSFGERRSKVKGQVIQLLKDRAQQPVKQATGTILPLLEETDYSNYPEIEVTATADTGPGSLRDAVAKAETMNGSRIVFRLQQTDPNFDAQTGVWTIQMNSKLSIRANRMLIDGLSQAQFGGETNPNGPEIMILNGTTTREILPAEGGGLFVATIWYLVNSSQDWVRGLIFNAPREQGNSALGSIGIVHTDSFGNAFASGNKVTKCWFGLSSNGESLLSEFSAWSLQLSRGCRNNLFEENVICTLNIPIFIAGSVTVTTSIGNVIRRNYIGTNKSGNKRLQTFRTFVPTAAGGTAPTGIEFLNGSRENIVEDNLFAGSQSGGIGSFNDIDQDASGGNIIRRNRIGVGVNGENIAPIVPPDNVPTPANDFGAFAVGISAYQNDIIEDNIIGNFKLGGISL